MFYKKCNASRNVKGRIENVVSLSTLGPTKDLPLMWCREFFSWEDIAKDPDAGKFIEGSIGNTPHRASDSILAEAEGDPGDTRDGVILRFKRWKAVNGITVGKDRSKITVPEGAFFLPGIPQILYASSFVDHLGGISPSRLSSGHWRAFGRQQLPDGTLGTWQEWNDKLRREAPYDKVNTRRQCCHYRIVSRMLEYETLLMQHSVA
ncbi:hypothetical protein LTR27_012069 [Elasticomyces elasticus]|nr:hypothetical protein LTR27_012069 [Elasticomyces elasticus]